MLGLVAAVGVVALLLLLRTSRAAASESEQGAVDIERNTRGLRNHNPANLRYVESIQWDGQTGADADGYAQFTDDMHGLRAAFINLHTGFTRGADTVRKAIARWAPASENPTQAYVTFVARRLGVSPDQRLTFAAIALPMMRAIVAFENGRDPYPADLYTAALTASGR